MMPVGGANVHVADDVGTVITDRATITQMNAEFTFTIWSAPAPDAFNAVTRLARFGTRPGGATHPVDISSPPAAPAEGVG